MEASYSTGKLTPGELDLSTCPVIRVMCQTGLGSGPKWLKPGDDPIADLLKERAAEDSQ